MRVLVIDDDAALRQTIRLMLEKAGHSVAEAGDGQEGLLRFREAPADLVISDIIMPEKEGVQTIAELRKIGPPHLRIIAMSGGGNVPAPTYLHFASRFGADATLSKPFTRSELLQAVAGDSPTDQSL